MTTNQDIKAAREYVKLAEISRPAELDWAEDVMLNHTTYSRRRYPGTFYVWADCSVVDGNTGKAWACDPWPSAQYPRAVLLTSLIRAKIGNPDLAVATAVMYAPAMVGAFDGGDGIG